MRKLLLASAAMLGATAGIASAQVIPTPGGSNPMQGQMPAPGTPVAGANTSNNFVGMPSTYTGSKYGLTAIAIPPPGTVVVHIGAKIETDFMVGSAPNNPGGAGSGGTASTAAGAVAPAPAKFNPISFGSFLRLYPGVDGQATNGLRYGAQAEIRENFPSSAAQPYPSQNAAAGPSAATSGQTLFVRRAFTYMAADNFGIVRFGNGDGVIGLFDPCTFESGCGDAGFGGFQTGIGGLGATSNVGNVGDFFALAQNGAEYGNTKIVYLSPQFFGVDFGIQYAPNMGNSDTPCSVGIANQVPINGTATPSATTGQTLAAAGAATGCTAATSGTDGTRWYNQVAVGARWMGDFGAFHAGAYAVYETAGKENNYAAAASATKTWNGTYANLSFVQAGLFAKEDTAIGSFIEAVTYSGGNVNTTLSMTTTGGAKLQGFQPGITYFNGPWAGSLVGFFLTEQGTAGLSGITQRHETGFLASVNYNFAPGLYVDLEYQYEARHQGNNNFITGATTGAGALLNNDVHAQALILTTVVNW